VRKPRAQKLSIRLVGMTNDVAGTRIAIFTLRTTDLVSVQVADPVVELRNQPLIIGGGLFLRNRVSPGKPRTMKIVMPTTQDEWRVAVYYYSASLRDRVREAAARLLGIQMRSHLVTFSTVHSDWMAPTSQMDWLGSDWMKP